MKTYILCCGKIVDAGPIDWKIAPPPEPEPDGTLQDIEDIANADMMAEDWAEFWLDQAWMNGGI